MRTLIGILSILLLNVSHAQKWSTIDNTTIQFSSLLKPNGENWNEFYYEYFKNGDKIIAVEKNLAQDFVDLFRDYPQAYDSIFIYSFRKTVKGDGISDLFADADSILFKQDFKTAVILSKRDIAIGHNEVVWIIKNKAYNHHHHQPCEINIAFQKPINSSGRLKFLSVKDMGCEI